METMPLLYFQAVLLERIFARAKFPVTAIRNMLFTILPMPFSCHLPLHEDIPEDAEALKRAIINGGSAVYNELVDQLRDHGEIGFPQFLDILTDHQVKQMFRYVWISSHGVTVRRRGSSWFTNASACRAAGHLDKPIQRQDESLTLCVESCCLCYIHHIDEPRYNTIGLPCKCFDERFLMPAEDVKFTNGIRPPSLSTPRPNKSSVRRIQNQ